MNLNEVMAALEAAGSEQTRKTYGRHGVETTMFGVKFGDLEKIRKQIKQDHALALELWKTGNHDACVLANFIVDHSKLDAAFLRKHQKGLTSRVGCELFAGMAAQAPDAFELMQEWRKADDEWTSIIGWSMVGHLLQYQWWRAPKETGPGKLPDSLLKELITEIEATIHSRPNFTRYAMNGALISIGTVSDELEKLAIAAAKRIGDIRVDHGATSCKTPEAASYIVKARAHVRGKEAKGAKTTKKPAAKKTAKKVTKKAAAKAPAKKVAKKAAAKKVTKKAAKKKAGEK